MADDNGRNDFSDLDLSGIFTDLETDSDRNAGKEKTNKQKFVVHIDDSVDGSFEYDFAAFSSAADREKEEHRRAESRATFKQFDDEIVSQKETENTFGSNSEEASIKRSVVNRRSQKRKIGKDDNDKENDLSTENQPSSDLPPKTSPTVRKTKRRIVERNVSVNEDADNTQNGNTETETNNMPDETAKTQEKKIVRLKTRSKRGVFTGFFGFVAITLVFTLIFTCVGLSTIGDVVAYNRDEKSVTVVIENEKNGDPPTLEHVISALHSAGLIKQKYLCMLFAKFRHYDGYTDSVTGEWISTEYLSGVYYLEPKQGIEGMLNTIKKSVSTGADTVTLVFPEGWTVSQIFERLEKNGVCEQSKLYANIETVAKQYDFYYNIENSGVRYLGVEGYLFPDTYEFFKNENAVSVLKKLFDNSDAKWKKSYEKKAKALGYTRDEILNIASIIQREAANSSQMGDISSVIHNRLKSSTYPSLQCNSTLDYVTNSVKSHVDANLAEIYSNAYNTYRIEGLPPGPICNPGIDAIKAALEPNDTNYYFFVHNNKGKIYLSENYNQFQKDCVQVAKDNA